MLEEESLKKRFFHFIVPSIVAQWVYTLYTMVDGIFVARGVSEIALAAVNLSLPFMAGVFSIALLFAVGTSTAVAILIGEGKEDEASEVFTQNIVLLTLLSIGLSVLVLCRLEPFALYLGATEDTLEYVKTYIGTLAPFVACFILSYTFEVLMKTDGHPRKATRIVTIGAIANVVLDYFFVMVFHWGVFGAAIATGISQTAVIVCYFWHFGKAMGIIRFRKFSFRPELIAWEFRNGLPSGLTEFSAGIIIFFFNQAILSYLGEYALVSYTIIAYVNSLVVMTMNGIAQGVQPLQSYYYGRREAEEIRMLFKYSLRAALVAGIISFAAAFGGAGWITGLFLEADSPELTRYTVQAMRIFSLSFLIVGFNVVVGGYFTAIKCPRGALEIAMARGLVTMVLSLWLLTALFGGPGIWWAPLLSEGLCLLLTWRLWKRRQGLLEERFTA